MAKNRKEIDRKYYKRNKKKVLNKVRLYYNANTNRILQHKKKWYLTKKKDEKMFGKPCNIYKPFSKEYYRDQLRNIHSICYDYDGCNVNSATQMKELVDDIREMVFLTLKGKQLYRKV